MTSPITHPAFSVVSPTLRSVALVLVTTISAGCAATPRDAFRLSESALETRQMQTRQYDDIGEAQILSASSALLQDLGYIIDEVETRLGVLSASKRADARDDLTTLGTIAVDVTECFITFLVGCTGNHYRSSDAVQDIRVTLVALPVHNESGAVKVRVTMQRIVRDRDNRVSRQQTITDVDVYQAFFEKLSKSVFLAQEGL